MRGITKSFGGAQALRGVDFTIRRAGEIHTLVGENGSGKSTLLNVLSGQVLPDEGSIEILGQPVQLRSARAAITHGIVMVSQETSIAPELSVAENILMGRQGNAYSWVRPSRMHEKAKAVLRRLGLSYDTSSLVRDLRADERQMVEVARAISMEARIIILDEPTSSLTEDEVARLYGAIERLKNEGVAVVFV
jgi:ABC-type sugar transport system ATPase subunit